MDISVNEVYECIIAGLLEPPPEAEPGLQRGLALCNLFQMTDYYIQIGETVSSNPYSKRRIVKIWGYCPESDEGLVADELAKEFFEDVGEW